MVSHGRLKGGISLLSMFLEHLSESAGRLLISTADAEPVCVTFAKKFILEKCEERLTVAQVARCVSLHPDYFGKIFRNATGMTLTEYTARVRVEKVKDRLPERSFRIGEVAFAAGFPLLAHLNRQFYKYATLFPSQYPPRPLAGHPYGVRV